MYCRFWYKRKENDKTKLNARARARQLCLVILEVHLDTKFLKLKLTK